MSCNEPSSSGDSRTTKRNSGLFSFFKWFKNPPGSSSRESVDGEDSSSSSTSSLSSSGSSISVNSTYSTGTVASFSYVQPDAYNRNRVAEKRIAPGPETDTYRARLKQREKIREKDKNITLRKKYNLFFNKDTLVKSHSSAAIVAEEDNSKSLPLMTKKISSEEPDRLHRRTASESSKIKKAGAYLHVKGKRKAPQPPDNKEDTSSLRRRKRVAPAPPPARAPCKDDGMETPDSDVICNDSLKLDHGILRSAKGEPLQIDTSAPSSIRSSYIEPPVSPRPWYKRNVAASTTGKKDKNESGSERLPELQYARNSTTDLNLDEAKIESKLKKEEKRKSGISFLTNISELDREAAELLKKDKEVACEMPAFMRPKPEQITTDSLSSPKRKSAKDLIAKFNAITSVTKVTVNAFQRDKREYFGAKTSKSQEGAKKTAKKTRNEPTVNPLMKSESATVVKPKPESKETPKVDRKSWYCPKCRLENDYWRIICHVCSTIKPYFDDLSAPPTKTSGIIAEDKSEPKQSAPNELRPLKPDLFEWNLERSKTQIGFSAFQKEKKIEKQPSLDENPKESPETKKEEREKLIKMLIEMKNSLPKRKISGNKENKRTSIIEEGLEALENESKLKEGKNVGKTTEGDKGNLGAVSKGKKIVGSKDEVVVNPTGNQKISKIKIGKDPGIIIKDKTSLDEKEAIGVAQSQENKTKGLGAISKVTKTNEETTAGVSQSKGFKGAATKITKTNEEAGANDKREKIRFSLSEENKIKFFGGASAKVTSTNEEVIGDDRKEEKRASKTTKINEDVLKLKAEIRKYPMNLQIGSRSEKEAVKQSVWADKQVTKEIDSIITVDEKSQNLQVIKENLLLQPLIVDGKQTGENPIKIEDQADQKRLLLVTQKTIYENIKVLNKNETSAQQKPLKVSSSAQTASVVKKSASVTGAIRKDGSFELIKPKDFADIYNEKMGHPDREHLYANWDKPGGGGDGGVASGSDSMSIFVNIPRKLSDFRNADLVAGNNNNNTDTLEINRLLRRLETAIAKGEMTDAAVFARELAQLKVNCSVIRQRQNKTDQKKGTEFTVNMFVEDRLSHRGPFPIQVTPEETVGELKRQVEKDFEIPVYVQRWILGKELAADDNSTLKGHRVTTNGCPVFLYLVAPTRDSKPAEKSKEAESSTNQLKETTSNAKHPPITETIEIKIETIEPVAKDIKDLLLQPSTSHHTKPTVDKTVVQETLNVVETKVDDPPKAAYRKSSSFEEDFVDYDCKTLKPQNPDWECRMCTLLNPLSSNICAVCATVRQKEQAPKAVKRKAPQPTRRKAETTKALHLQLLDLDNGDLVTNTEAFECMVCLMEIGTGEGVTLRECLHQFCKQCLAYTIEFTDEAEIKCPYRDDQYSCDIALQDREVKALVAPNIYEQYLARSVAQVENKIEKSFHCKTPDCKGWCIFEDNVNEFRCPVCLKLNCLTCQAIHTGMNCKQYQEKMNAESDIDENAKRTREMLEEMVNKGEALTCPVCQVILMKKWGCDWVRCSMCKTEICWVTRGPRWGPAGKGDTSGGCKCGVNGIKCHAQCNYCH